MEKYWVWLSLLKLSDRQKKNLTETVPNPQELFDTLWDTETLPESVLEEVNQKDIAQAEEICEVCQEQGIRIIGFWDKEYPPRLRGISDPPMVLYCLGTPPQWTEHPLVAVVGTRKLSSYGEKNSLRLGKQIASCGGIVVSGGALGVDALAMDGALRESLPVVGVLGTGVDVFYPKANTPLLQKVIQQGCLLSEYLPGTKAQPWQFPRRNRIVSGMSNAVLVVEAPEKSGALITAELAREQGREIYVVPGGVGLESSDGSNRLLQNGASAVLTGWDVMRDFETLFPTVQKAPGCTEIYGDYEAQHVAQKPKIPPVKERENKQFHKNLIDNGEKSSYSIPVERLDLTQEEAQICAHLTGEFRDMDVVMAELDMPSGKALSILMKLSLTGVVENIPEVGVRLK